MAESVSQYIEQLSALPPRQRLEAFCAISDPALRRRVAKELPFPIFSEILGESMLESLNRNVAAEMERRNPGQAA